MISRFIAILLISAACAGTAHARTNVHVPVGPTVAIAADLGVAESESQPHADKVTLEQAVRRVRKQYGGRIVSAETRGGSKRTHVIKVLTDKGRVVTVRIPAN
ncbi:MAG: hypothetical protein AAF004_15955 [Pseudomonadota bacterium]